MNNPFEQIGFSLEITKDGSPTLRLNSEKNRLREPDLNLRPSMPESMHHSGGAAAETNYIYKSVINQALQSTKSRRPNSSFQSVVVGLGLGYIEISWAQTLIRNKINPQEDLGFDSFEIIPELRQQFKDWIYTDQPDSLYDLICEKLDPQIEVAEIKKLLRRALASGSQFHSDILTGAQSMVLKNKWNTICFDAFSQKTSGPLWEEIFLQSFIKNNAHDDCVFTTYACTGLLKKILVENGFEFIKRPGFSGKRDSTVAVRGFFKEDLKLFQIF